MKLSQKLRLLREEKGITQQALADKLGIGIQSIRNYENDTLDRMPNTVQLKMLKDFYNVTYEYLLDNACENKTNDSIDIGKILKLSDTAIEQIINLQNYTNFSDNSKKDDKESPIAFNTWIENFAALKEFSLYINDYYILKDLLGCCNYFSNILELKAFFIECLNNSKNELDSIFKLLDSQVEIYKNCVIHGDTCSKLDNNSYKELLSYIKKLKNYCELYNKSHSSSLEDDLFNILNEIVEIGVESYQYTYKDLQFCQYQITELIRDNLHEISKPNETANLPSEYKILKNKLKKEGNK